MKSKKIQVDLLFTNSPYCVSRNYQLEFSNMDKSGMSYGALD